MKKKWSYPQNDPWQSNLKTPLLIVICSTESRVISAAVQQLWDSGTAGKESVLLKGKSGYPR